MSASAFNVCVKEEAPSCKERERESSALSCCSVSLDNSLCSSDDDRRFVKAFEFFGGSGSEEWVERIGEGYERNWVGFEKRERERVSEVRKII